MREQEARGHSVGRRRERETGDGRGRRERDEAGVAQARRRCGERTVRVRAQVLVPATPPLRPFAAEHRTQNPEPRTQNSVQRQRDDNSAGAEQAP